VLFLFALYLTFGMVTMRIPEGTEFPGPRFLPGIIATGMFVLSVIQVISVLRNHRPSAPDRREPVGRDEVEQIAGTVTLRRTIAWGPFAWAVGGFLAFALLLQVLGWVLAATGLFWCVARAFGSRRVVMDLVVAATVSSIAYIAFDMLLGLSLPSGILGWGF
jgi:putative tricarboxylic transport membrane protein